MVFATPGLPSGINRQSLKRVGAVAARRLAPRRSGRARVVGLCYHSVHPTSSFSSATPEMFERHLAWLEETCDVIQFRRMVGAANDSGRVRPAVAITFDDGYADNHEFALPLLRQYRMPATIFVTAGLIDGDPVVRARFQELRGTSAADIRPLEWSQIRELRAEGLEIGGHTYSHPNLIRLDRSRIERELRVSKEILEDRLETTIDLLAYPFGKPRRHFDQTTVEVARETGYSQAAAVLFRAVRQRDSPLALPRFFTTRDSVADLAAKVRGDWDYLGLWQEKAPPAVAKIMSPADFRF
jgi:peptidoglycan/xylan/chitin deacetylase (PgdA/CDA1 family)